MPDGSSSARPTCCAGPALRGSWQDLATADPDRVPAWWARTAYSIGVACGPSGLVVIDLDTPPTGRPGDPPAAAESGTDALAVLCGQHGHSAERRRLLQRFVAGREHGCTLGDLRDFDRCRVLVE